MGETTLLAGTAVCDITPPLEVGLLISSVNGLYAPFESVRLPLSARVLVLKWEEESVAIVSLDLLSINDTSVGGWNDFKRSISGSVPAGRILLCCTHTHNAPESGAISELYLTQSYRVWLTEITTKLRQAIEAAFHSAVLTEIGLSVGELVGYSLQRRIQTDDGVVMSDALQPIEEKLFNIQPIDHRVRSLHFKQTNGTTIATLVQAVCHPVHEMCLPHISPEFPGELCLALEEAGQSGTALFLNGAAGDINPPTVSMGPEYAKRHGIALAETVLKNKNRLPLHISNIGFVHADVQLKVRDGSNVSNPYDACAILNVLNLDSVAIVFLPGEPFLDLALQIEKNSPFEHTIVVGFSENNIGYIPTLQAFPAGGYEVGPGKWSFLQADAFEIIRDKALELLQQLHVIRQPT